MKKSVSTASIEVFTIKNPQNDINNQILLAKSENSFVREVTVNAYESPSCATKIVWGKTDPALVGLTGYNTSKLSCWNNGHGMTKDTLASVTNFSSSGGKTQGIHGNKGKGEKLSGMAINSAGMIWVSCTKDPHTGLRKVYRVVMIGDSNRGEWGRQKFLIEDEYQSRQETVVDITEVVDLEQLGLDIEKDWTLKIYCGVEANQNTVKNLYGQAENDDGTGIRRAGVGKNSQGWLVRELTRRFPTLPEGVTIEIADDYLTNDGKKEFLPVLDAIKQHSGDTNIAFETIRVVLDKEIKNDADQYSILACESLGKELPFFTENKTVSVTYVYDPACGMKGNENKCTLWYKTRMGVTGVFSGLIYKNELYDFRGPQPSGQKGAPDWKGTAFDLGIIDGYDQFRVFVTLPEADHIVNDENRTKIIDKSSTSKDEFLLRNFRKVVQFGMPQWFKDQMEKYKPKIPDDKELQEKYNTLLEKWGQYKSASKTSGGTHPGLYNNGDRKHKQTHDYTCPECAKNGKVTIIPRGIRKCSVCGYIKPPIKGNSTDKNGTVDDINGKSRTIKKWPETVTFHSKEEWNGLNLCDNFEQMAAQYLYDDGKLYVNATYPSFAKLTNLLLDHIGVHTSHPEFALIQAEAQNRAENFIKDACLCQGLFSAIVKTNEPGFKGDDEGWKRSVSPTVLSVYSDHWIGSWNDGDFTKPVFRAMKKWYTDRYGDHDNISLNNFGEIESNWESAGVRLPNKELV